MDLVCFYLPYFVFERAKIAIDRLELSPFQTRTTCLIEAYSSFLQEVIISKKEYELL